MNSKPDEIILLVNDSYFSYLLSSFLITERHPEISLIIFSKSIKNSGRKIFSIFKKSSKRFFFYRMLVQLITIFFYRRYTVSYLAKKYRIPTLEIDSLKEVKNEFGKDTVAFAFNFDMVLNKNFINKFGKGIFNIHASKLPFDKGISPVLWAFSRGDREIWSTIYKIDLGIDSGDIFTQFKTEVYNNDSAFSLYKRVCIKSGKELNNRYEELTDNPVLHKQPFIEETSYFSWPDLHFDRMLIKNRRKLIKISDLRLK